MRRRSFLLAGGLVAIVPGLVVAQEYPTKVVRIVNPFGAGGALDQLARSLGQKMSDSMGQQFIVENKTGAGGNIGADFVAKSAPDGYTLIMGSSATHGINPTLYTALPFDAHKDFTPISVAVVQKNVLVINPAVVPVNNVAELIAFAKANPGKLSFGSAGTGTSQHLSGEMFKSMAGVDLVHVPYKGSAAAMTDLLGGQIAMMFTDIPVSLPHIKSGRLKVLGVTSAQPAAALPDVVPLAQQGLPGFDLKAWYGVMGPGNMPKPIVDKLNAEITKALKSPDLRDSLESRGMEIIALDVPQSTSYVKTEMERWAQAVKTSGAKAQ